MSARTIFVAASITCAEWPMDDFRFGREVMGFDCFLMANQLPINYVSTIAAKLIKVTLGEICHLDVSKR